LTRHLTHARCQQQSLSEGINTYTWNARDELIGISGSGLSAAFQYDSFGTRTARTVNSSTLNFLHDGGNVVQEQSDSLVIANLLTGLGVDELFTRTDSTGTSTFVTDALGSSLALLDNNGAVQTQYSYEPFGHGTTGRDIITRGFSGSSVRIRSSLAAAM
jgi:hypothetical protein